MRIAEPAPASPPTGTRAEDNGLTFSHKVHLDARGGVARMAMGWAAARAATASSAAPTATIRPTMASATRLDMQRDCGPAAASPTITSAPPCANCATAMSRRCSPTSRSRPRRATRSSPPALRPNADDEPYAAHFGTPLPSPGAAAPPNGSAATPPPPANGHGGAWSCPSVITTNGWFDHARTRDSEVPTRAYCQTALPT